MKFVVKEVDSDKTVVAMEADGLHSIPDPATVVNVTDDDGYDSVVDIVKDYISYGLDAQQIAGRMNGYHYYMTYETDLGDTPDEIRENVRKRIEALMSAQAKAQKTEVQKDDEVTFTGTGLISKADDEQQIVYGWAYVTHDRDGNVVVDKSGDFVDDVVEIEKTAVRFVLNTRNTDVDHTNVRERNQPMSDQATDTPVSLTPVSHATAVLEWGGEVIYTDPVDRPEVFRDLPRPTLILVTDIHPDHLNTDTLTALLTGNTAALVVPPAVAAQLPSPLRERASVLSNGESTTVGELTIEAVPMYNLPDQQPIYHEKGRGNGYILQRDEVRVYVAGDTADTPEMRALHGIDIALVPMNLPFTMSVERAADAVAAFAPRQVYPYHYRGPDGQPADIARFKSLVNQANPSVEVVLLDWYPQR